MKRVKAIVSGRVQNVGFRGFCTQLAMQYKLTGEVRNLDNGDVQVTVQGPQNDIDEFFVAVSKGNRFIKIRDITYTELGVVEGEKKFKYLY